MSTIKKISDTLIKPASCQPIDHPGLFTIKEPG